MQNGLNSVFGNVGLRKEQIHQFNVGINGTYENVRAGFNAFYAFMPDYITMQNLGLFQVQLNSGGNSFTGTTPITKLQFINTPLATLYGFDAFAEYDVLPYLTPFATLSFVEGWDQGRDEALPGISPLDFARRSAHPRAGQGSAPGGGIYSPHGRHAGPLRGVAERTTDGRLRSAQSSRYRQARKNLLLPRASTTSATASIRNTSTSAPATEPTNPASTSTSA